MIHIKAINYHLNPMGRTKCSSSGDMFSFPVIIQQQNKLDSDDFEFGSITSPTCPNSPADHLFSNGKLLPHAFPIQTPNNFSYSRSTSRTSSKDSLMSSRSTSTNSRSSTSTSTSSSARTSTSEVSERRLSSADYGTTIVAGRKERIIKNQYQYGSSRRWQLIAAAPVLKHQESKSRKIDRKGSKKSRGSADEECKRSKSWCGRNFFKSFISACQECHAIKT